MHVHVLIMPMLHRCGSEGGVTTCCACSCFNHTYVTQVLKRRRRDYMLKSAVATVRSSFHLLWSWILTLLTLLALPVTRCTDRWRHRLSTGSDVSHMDHSISDGELPYSAQVHNSDYWFINLCKV